MPSVSAHVSDTVQLARADGYARRVMVEAMETGRSIHELINPVKPYLSAGTGREPGPGNTAVLSALCEKRGFESRIFATQKAVLAAGGAIRDGEKAIWLMSVRQEHEMAPKKDEHGAVIINPENGKPDLIRVPKMFPKMKDGKPEIGPDGKPVLEEAPRKFYPFGVYMVDDQTKDFQPKFAPLEPTISKRSAPSVRAVWDAVKMPMPVVQQGREFSYDFGPDAIIVPTADDVRDPRPQTAGAYHLACCLALAAAHPKRLNIASLADGAEYAKHQAQAETSMYLAAGMVLTNHTDESKIDWKWIRTQGEDQIAKWMRSGSLNSHAAISTADKLYRHIAGIPEWAR